jgi:myo-inositol-1(or 4)-monophosphatase
MNPELQYIPVFLRAAHAGAEVLMKYFGESLVTTQKTTYADIQTKADLDSEAAILSILEKGFPQFNILSEERGDTKNGSEYTIVVDPLDGTNNFSCGIPNFTITVALFHGKSLLAGLIYHPTTSTAYYAEAGKGAYCNNRKMSVNAESELQKTAISYVPGYVTARTMSPYMMSALVEELKIKRFHHNWSGAADACFFAAGRIESVIIDQCQLYDFAAGKLIAREAGAKITSFDGGPSEDDTVDRFIMTNGTAIHEPILKVWQKVSAQRQVA